MRPAPGRSQWSAAGPIVREAWACASVHQLLKLARDPDSKLRGTPLGEMEGDATMDPGAAEVVWTMSNLPNQLVYRNSDGPA